MSKPTLILGLYAVGVYENTHAADFYNIVDASYGSEPGFFPDAMTNSVNKVIAAINANPGPFALAGMSYGAWVMSKVLIEIQSGSLTARQPDFLGAVVTGNPARQSGHTLPAITGAIDPGGHGILGSTDRLTTSPDNWYEVAAPGDLMAVNGDTAEGLLATGLFEYLYNDPTSGQRDITAAVTTFLAEAPSQQIVSAYNAVVEGASWIIPHLSYAAYHPITGDARNSIELGTYLLTTLAINGGFGPNPAPTPPPTNQLQTLGERMVLAKQNRARRRAVKGGTPSIRAYMNDTVDTLTPGLTYYGRIAVKDTNDYEFPQRNNFSTTGQIRLRANHYVAKWVITNPNTPQALQNIIFIVDMYGGAWRWSGLVHHYELETVDGCDYVTIFINDDLQFLQFLLAPPNPSLPLYIFQFPRVWFIFGPSIWCISVTILLNLIRTEGHAWTLPDDPYNLDSWLSAPDFATWQIHVKSVDFFTDSSLWTLLASRMNTIDSMIADALDDGQLSIVYRRILTAEGETVTGLLDNNVGNGSLVFEIIDRSGFTLPGGTFFNGTAASGLVRSVLTWTDGSIQDSLNETIDSETLYPDEYWQTSWLGTLASAPGITLRDTHWNDLQSKVTHSPSTAPTVIVGGDNPMADAIVQLIIESVGNLVGFALLGGFDSLGDIIADVVMPFLVGTIVAWDEWENTGRAQQLGWVHLIEVYQSGAENNSWSLAALEVLRGGFTGTRAQTSHTMVINWTTWVTPGLDFQIGDRIASTSGALQRAGLDIMLVNQVQEMTLTGKGDGSFQFFTKVGQNKASMTPGEREARLYKKFLSTLTNVGVHLIS